MEEQNQANDIQSAKEISNDILKKQSELLERIAESNQKLDELRERSQEFLHPDQYPKKEEE